MFLLSDIQIWRRIKIGIGLKTVDDFRKAFGINGLHLDNGAIHVLDNEAFTVAEQEIEVDLVRMAVRDLGFNETKPYDLVCSRALELGLELCPAEIGPQLRLQYLDQRKDGHLLVAMQPIIMRGHREIFELMHREDGLHLNADLCDYEETHQPGQSFVFVLPKKIPKD